MHQNIYMSDVRKSSTCYHLFEPQDIFSLGSGPLLCRAINRSGTCIGYQSEVPNLELYHTTPSPSCSLSTYCLCCSCYRFSVSKHVWHCLSHMYFTSPPPSCFIQRHHPLPSQLQFAVWKHFWHCPTYTLFTASAVHMVPLLSSCLSDRRHTPHCPSKLYRVLRQTAQVLGTFLLCSLVCSSQPLTVTLSMGLA